MKCKALQCSLGSILYPLILLFGVTASGQNVPGFEQHVLNNQIPVIPEVELKAEHIVKFQVPLPQAAGSEGTYHSASVVIGPRNGDFIAKVTGWNFATNYPAQVFCQSRQNQDQNNDFRWPDQFAVQVIETSNDFVRIRIRRIDDGTGISGWGQNLRIDILVIE